jgi:hypothetical protein
MVEVSVEVCSGDSSFMTAVRAESIQRADEIARNLYPDSDVKVVFPIDPDRFFVVEPRQVGAPVANLLV